MKLKRIMAIVLCFAMVLSTMSFNVFANESTVGTEEDIILINTAEDLIALGDAVNSGDNYAGKYVMLNDDIDLSSVSNWTPIGDVLYNSNYAPADTTKVFSGTFDGNGKAISNLKIEKILNDAEEGPDADANVGLFGIIGEGAVIRDLTITNVNINTDGRNVGALAGVAYKAALDNITVNGNIKISGGNNTCGVCAMTRYYDVSATNITVSGEDGSYINGNNIVAGMFAEIAPNGSNQTFENLSVENVAIKGVGGVGGIVGLLTLGTVSDVTVKDVTLVGKTTWNEEHPEGRIRLGSVVGLLGSNYSTISDATVENVTAKNLEGEDVVLPVVGANYSGSIGNATEAKIGDTYYATLPIAVSAAEDGDTITLLCDIEDAVEIPDGVTLDTNGYSFGIIEIYDWEDLKELDALVEGGNLIEGATVKLMNDIDLYEMGADDEPVSFNPIGANKAYFKGTFDGQGHTIKNMYQSGWALGYDWDNYGTIGLFAYLWDATIKNLTIENAECLIEGGNVAAIAGCAWGNCTFENITVKNSTYATYNNRAAGIVGYTGGEGTMTFKDITVDEDTVIAALWGSYDCTLGGVVGSTHNSNVTEYVFEDVTVACKLDCYNDMTASYKWYSYRMCGMLIGSMKALQEGTTEVDPRDIVTLKNVDITIGEWANQTYIWDDSLSKGCQRVEPGYQYGGVNVETYPDAEITTKSFNIIIGGPQSQSQGYYGSDITKLQALEGFDTSTLKVTDLAEIARDPAVAKVGDTYFETLEEAFKAVTAENNVVEILKDVTVDSAWDCRSNGAKFTVPVTINGNNKTLTFTGDVKDNNWNTIFRIEDVATVKNLTIDASAATSIQRGISSKLSITAENVTLIGNGSSAKRAIIFGEGAGAAESTVTATITDCTFINWSYGVSDSQSGRDSKAVSVSGSTFTNASALLSAAEKVEFTDNEMDNGYVNITSYSAENNLEVVATGNTLAVVEGEDNQINAKTIEAQEGFLTPVASVGGKYYLTLAKAVDKAKDGETVTLIWNEGGAPIAMNGAVYGKSVTITGDAVVDWSKGFLFVGRGGEGNGTVIFDNANLKSASNSSSYGIHVSGREKNTTNKYDGTLTIIDSEIELDYLINKGNISLDNSSLTVKNGFAIGGRPASETEEGVDATATIDLKNGSKVVVNNHNGMGLGYEAIGIMNIDKTSAFKSTQNFLITAKGTINVNGGNVNVEGNLEVKGTLKSNGNVFGNIVAADTAVIEITGGLYTQDVSQWCADGYKCEINGDGTYSVNKTELFKVAGTTTSLDSSLALNIYLNSSDLTGEDYYAIVEHAKAMGEVVRTNIPYTDWVTSGNYKTIRYTGIAAKEMADELTITIYDSKGTQVSETFKTSLRDYALSTMNRFVANNETSSLWLPALTDMLNYGAAAQIMFNYNTGDLASAGAEVFQTYASSEYTLDKDGCVVLGSVVGTTLTLEDMIKLNVYFKDVTEGMYAKYSYKTHAGTSIEKTVDYASFVNSWGYLGVSVDDIAIADAATLVKVTMYNSDDSVAGTTEYSVNAYLKDMIDKGKDDPLYPALAKFAASAKKAFAEK